MGQKGIVIHSQSDCCMVCDLPLNKYPNTKSKKQSIEPQKIIKHKRKRKDSNHWNIEEEEDDESKEMKIGETRLNIIKRQKIKKPPFNKINNNLNLPSIKVFHCRHFYHVDCYREAQFDKKYNISFEQHNDSDKCLICFSGHSKKIRF